MATNILEKLKADKIAQSKAKSVSAAEKYRIERSEMEKKGMEILREILGDEIVDSFDAVFLHANVGDKNVVPLLCLAKHVPITVSSVFRHNQWRVSYYVSDWIDSKTGRLDSGFDHYHSDLGSALLRAEKDYKNLLANLTQEATPPHLLPDNRNRRADYKWLSEQIYVVEKGMQPFRVTVEVETMARSADAARANVAEHVRKQFDIAKLS